MKTPIMPIGNSRGIRIPKLLLDKLGLSGEVEISAEDESLMIRPVKSGARLGRGLSRDGDKPLRSLLDPS